MSAARLGPSVSFLSRCSRRRANASIIPFDVKSIRVLPSKSGGEFGGFGITAIIREMVIGTAI